MKKTKDIVGLPVISISRVSNLGKVTGVLINPERGAMDFVVVAPQNRHAESRVIAIDRIIGIGGDALTVENDEDVQPLSANGDARRLADADVPVIGSRLMTNKGDLVGVISEIGIDEGSGKITGCEWIPDGQDKPAGVIAGDVVLTYGRELTVVRHDFMNTLASGFGQGITAQGLTIKNTPPAFPGPDSPGRDPLKYFEEQQKQHLLGRKLTADLKGADGSIIAEKGQVITQEIIDQALANDKFVELTLNNSEQ